MLKKGIQESCEEDRKVTPSLVGPKKGPKPHTAPYALNSLDPKKSSSLGLPVVTWVLFFCT